MAEISQHGGGQWGGPFGPSNNGNGTSTGVATTTGTPTILVPNLLAPDFAMTPEQQEVNNQSWQQAIDYNNNNNNNSSSGGGNNNNTSGGGTSGGGSNTNNNNNTSGSTPTYTPAPPKVDFRPIAQGKADPFGLEGSGAFKKFVDSERKKGNFDFLPATTEKTDMYKEADKKGAAIKDYYAEKLKGRYVDDTEEERHRMSIIDSKGSYHNGIDVSKLEERLEMVEKLSDEEYANGYNGYNIPENMSEKEFYALPLDEKIKLHNEISDSDDKISREFFEDRRKETIDEYKDILKSAKDKLKNIEDVTTNVDPEEVLKSKTNNILDLISVNEDGTVDYFDPRSGLDNQFIKPYKTEFYDNPDIAKGTAEKFGSIKEFGDSILPGFGETFGEIKNYYDMTVEDFSKTENAGSNIQNMNQKLDGYISQLENQADLQNLIAQDPKAFGDIEVSPEVLKYLEWDKATKTYKYDGVNIEKYRDEYILNIEGDTTLKERDANIEKKAIELAGKVNEKIGVIKSMKADLNVKMSQTALDAAFKEAANQDKANGGFGDWWNDKKSEHFEKKNLEIAQDCAIQAIESDPKSLGKMSNTQVLIVSNPVGTEATIESITADPKTVEWQQATWTTIKDMIDSPKEGSIGAMLLDAGLAIPRAIDRDQFSQGLAALMNGDKASFEDAMKNTVSYLEVYTGDTSHMEGGEISQMYMEQAIHRTGMGGKCRAITETAMGGVNVVLGAITGNPALLAGGMADIVSGTKNMNGNNRLDAKEEQAQLAQLKTTALRDYDKIRKEVILKLPQSTKEMVLGKPVVAENVIKASINDIKNMPGRNISYQDLEDEFGGFNKGLKRDTSNIVSDEDVKAFIKTNVKIDPLLAMARFKM